MLAEMLTYIIERSQDFTTALGQHLYLTFLSLGLSILLGVGLGIVATRLRRLRDFLLNLGNIGRTIPSLAILALALPLLGIGTPPTILALVLIGTLPILINTTVGIEQVDPSIKESARGMGMNDLQVLVRVELPIAIAVIMAGVRTSAVLVVASATLAAFIGGGGLGDLILRGHALGRDYIMLAGAIPATLLAFYFEETFGRLERWVTPKGLKIGTRQAQAQSSGLPELLAAVAVMPIVFGLLLPWVTYFDANGTRQVLTGLNPEFRAQAVWIVILGLCMALWPRKSQSTWWRVTLAAANLGALVGCVWMIVLLLQTAALLPAGQQLAAGPFLLSAGMLLLASIAVLELYRSFTAGFGGERSLPEEAALPSSV